MFQVNQFLPQDICLDCEGCCRFRAEASIWQPVILKEELNSAAEGVIPEQLILASGKIKSVPFKDSYACCFHEFSNNHCKIYHSRPLECRLYPFLINKTKEQIFLAVDLNCPFIKDKLKDGDFRKYTDYLVNFLSTRDISSMIKRNAQVFADYSGENIQNLSSLAF